jgi:hypothetical protein
MKKAIDTSMAFFILTPVSCLEAEFFQECRYQLGEEDCRDYPDDDGGFGFQYLGFQLIFKLRKLVLNSLWLR